MIADRYYYNHLSNKEKNVYTAIYKGVTALREEIFVSDRISKDSVSKVFHALSHDNPHLYYFNQTFMKYAATPFGMVFAPQYFCNREQIDTYNSRIEIIVNKLVADLRLNECSDLEKEKRVHDYFCLNVVYDHEALKTSKVDRLVAAHSIVGVFAKQRAVCEGIAKATKLLLNTVNVGCLVVSGNASLESQGGHSWNIVKVDGNAYHLDSTWDLANTKNGFICYDYFNLNDEEISADHFDFNDVPKCTETKANYFKLKELCFDSMAQLEQHLLKGLDDGNRRFLFRMNKEGHSMNQIVSVARNFLLVEANARNLVCKVQGAYNDEQRTGRIEFSSIV